MKLMLKANGILCVRWSTKVREHVSTLVPYEDALQFLSWPVEDTEGATVASLVQILRSDVQMYSGLLDAAFLKDVLDETPSTRKEVGLSKMLFSWCCDVYEYKGVKDFELYVNVSGVGPYEGEEHEGGPKNGQEIDNYALDFTPLVNMLDLPIGLDNNIIMHSSKKISRKKYEYVDTDLGHRHFTLYDLLYGLANEVSFHGTPEMRDGTMGEIQQRADDVTSGRTKTIPMEDVMREFDDGEDDEEGHSDTKPGPVVPDDGPVQG